MGKTSCILVDFFAATIAAEHYPYYMCKIHCKSITLGCLASLYISFFEIFNILFKWKHWSGIFRSTFWIIHCKLPIEDLPPLLALYLFHHAAFTLFLYVLISFHPSSSQALHCLPVFLFLSLSTLFLCSIIYLSVTWGSCHSWRTSDTMRSRIWNTFLTMTLIHMETIPRSEKCSIWQAGLFEELRDFFVLSTFFLKHNHKFLMIKERSKVI